MKYLSILLLLVLIISCTKDEEGVGASGPAFEAEFGNTTFIIVEGTATYRNNKTAIEFTFKGFQSIANCWDMPNSKDSLMFLIVPAVDVLGTHPLSSYSQDIPFKLIFDESKNPSFNKRIEIQEYDMTTGLIKGIFVREDVGYINECTNERVSIGDGIAKFECILN